MSFKSVCRSLQEVFPQVDVRILKAVAIEHSKDVDAAVEFILSEVLPFIGGLTEASYTLDDTQGENPSAEVGVNKQVVSLGHQGAEVDTLLSGPKSVACGSAPNDDHASPAHVKSPCMGEVADEGSRVQYGSDPKEPSSLMPYHEVVKESNASPSKAKSVEHDMDPISDPQGDAFYLKSNKKDKTKAGGFLSDVHGGNSCAQLISNAEPEEACLVEDIFRSAVNGNAALYPNAQVLKGIEACLGEDIFLSVPELAENGNGALHPNAQVLQGREACLVEDIFQSVPELAENDNGALHPNAQVLQGIEAKEAVSTSHTNAQNSSSVLVKTPNLMEYGAVVEKDINSSVSECEEQLSQCLNVPNFNQDLYGLEINETFSAAFTSAQDIPSSVLEKCSDFMNIGTKVQKDLNSFTAEFDEAENCPGSLAFETEMVSVDDSNLPSTISTRSGHVVSIDYLEDFIGDAKSNKKTLASAVETVTNVMKEVELLEERAKRAKEEASTAGQDILTKVEELKHMLKHAKEANEMHAGEVYGEKAILATEARELQSRLLSLSNERNKSLSIIEEIHQTLEARLAAAEEERAAAEQDKLEKEELARKAFHEQQVIMDAVVEESKKLQQEAEENSKLREFLMDRGHIVDMLQGEIAVICEDVLLLKERVDGRLPLSKSLSSTASSLVSSSSSSSFRKSSTTFSDRELHPVELGNSTHMITQEHPKAQQLESISNGDKEIYTGDKHGVSSDDDWELA